MNRVVVTGMGVISPLGNSIRQVSDSLREGRSGIVHMPDMAAAGYQCQVFGQVEDFDNRWVPRGSRRATSQVAQYGYAAAAQAVDDANLVIEQMPADRIGVCVSTCFSASNEVPEDALMITDKHQPSRLGAYGVVRIMNSTAAAGIASNMGIRGRVQSVSAGCATGLYSIGAAYDWVKRGVVDVCIAGGTEEETWRQTGLSGDNTAGMPRSFNDRPSAACRPFDRDREGFVMSEGAGVIVLETLEHAQARGARIYAEVTGYAAANDGDNVFSPVGIGLRLSLKRVLAQIGDVAIDYVNPHGTGTRTGDVVEAQGIAELLGDRPWVSSTKSLNGHSQGAAAAHEIVHCLIMMNEGFIAATDNLEHVDPECEGVRHVRERQDAPIDRLVKLSSGLGGVNACLAMSRWTGGDAR